VKSSMAMSNKEDLLDAFLGLFAILSRSVESFEYDSSE